MNPYIILNYKMKKKFKIRNPKKIENNQINTKNPNKQKPPGGYGFLSGFCQLKYVFELKSHADTK